MTHRQADDPKLTGIPEHLKHIVDEVEQAFLDEMKAGKIPDRAALLAPHPQIASLLEDHLDLLEGLFRDRRGGDDARRVLSTDTWQYSVTLLVSPPASGSG